MNEFTAIAFILTLFVLRFAAPVLVIMATAYLANHWLSRVERGQQPPTAALNAGD
jgi:hypothetical protein